MDVNDLTTRISFAQLVYQGNIAQSGDLSAAELQAIKQHAFPKSVPVDFRASVGFQALTLFPAQERLAISYVRDEGATDDWDRPILSARVLVGDPSVWNALTRDIVPITLFLAAEDFAPETSDTLIERLVRIVDEESALFSQETFAEVFSLTPFAVPYIARVLHACAFSRNVILHADAPGLQDKVLRFLLFCLPVHQLSQITIATVCADVNTLNRENLVFAAGAPETSWKQKLKHSFGLKKLDPEACCVIDLQREDIPEVRARTMPPAEFERILGELLEGPAWKPLAFRQKYQVLMAYLEYAYIGKSVNWGVLANQFNVVGEGQTLMKRFVEHT